MPDLAEQVDWSQAARLEYMPGPVALEAHRSKASVKLAWGPLGTAKTTWLCWRAKAIAERAAKAGYTARILFLRDTYRNLIDSTFQTWREWFPPDTALGFVAHSEPVDYRFNVGGRYHDILFRHAQTEQDASMFLSTEYDGIMLEEIAPAFTPGAKKISPGIAEGVFDMAISRLTRKADRAAAVRPELCMTCNSPPLPHWASKRIIDKSPQYLRDLNWMHWMFPISDNAHNLRPDYYTNLEKAWEGRQSLIDRFLKGKRLPIFIGLPRFNLDKLQTMREVAHEPTAQGYLVNRGSQVVMDPNAEGYVSMWRPPLPGKYYVIGADVAEGVEGGDYSSAVVMDRSNAEIVAEWHGHVDPGTFGDELHKLGRTYNEALLGVEANNHGLATLQRLKALSYKRLYYHREIDDRSKRPVQKMGWPTNVKTKPLMIDELALLINSDWTCPSVGVIEECQTYGIMENGSTEAQEGCYDDRVVAAAIAQQMRKLGGLERLYPDL